MGFEFAAVGKKYVQMSHHDKVPWMPTRNIAQAWELLEKFPAFQLFRRYPEVKSRHECVLYTAEDPNTAQKESLHICEADTAPLAIVKACLKAKGIEL
jgi:hypothetical protein